LDPYLPGAALEQPLSLAGPDEGSHTSFSAPSLARAEAEINSPDHPTRGVAESFIGIGVEMQADDVSHSRRKARTCHGRPRALSAS
jgi:hypothetical protein